MSIESRSDEAQTQVPRVGANILRKTAGVLRGAGTCVGRGWGDIVHKKCLEAIAVFDKNQVPHPDFTQSSVEEMQRWLAGLFDGYTPGYKEPPVLPEAVRFYAGSGKPIVTKSTK